MRGTVGWGRLAPAFKVPPDLIPDYATNGGAADRSSSATAGQRRTCDTANDRTRGSTDFLSSRISRTSAQSSGQQHDPYAVKRHLCCIHISLLECEVAMPLVMTTHEQGPCQHNIVVLNQGVTDWALMRERIVMSP
jgi:hypothetical protein